MRTQTRHKRSVKGISPVIATLLLVAIAVAASVLMYTFVNTLIMQQSSVAGTNMQIENVDFKKTGDVRNSTTIEIRNTGSTTIVLERMYITNSAGTRWVQSYSTGNVLETKATLILTFGNAESPSDYNWTLSSIYKIRMVSDTGFSVEGSFASPSK